MAKDPTPLRREPATESDGESSRSPFLSVRQVAEAPERVLKFAVKGMLPRNPLGRKMFSKLRVFAGPQHDHEAQQPIQLDIKA